MVLAIVGLPGAGKSEAAEYLVKKTGWPKVHFGDATADGLRKLGLEASEANERQFREDMRKRYGMAAYAILNLPKIKDLHQRSDNVLVESLYSWEEYLEVKKEFGEDFKILAIVASSNTRQRRMADRPDRPLTPDEFMSRDYSQIENLHQAGPIARADYFIINESSKEHLFGQLDSFIKNII